jgi:hypothetical protein
VSQAVQSVLRNDYPDLFFFLDREECGIAYSPSFREFGLRVRPQSPVQQQLRFCPFTGKALPGSLRNRFFDEIEKLGLVDGLADIERAPAEFQSETWWIARGL